MQKPPAYVAGASPGRRGTPGMVSVAQWALAEGNQAWSVSYMTLSSDMVTGLPAFTASQMALFVSSTDHRIPSMRRGAVVVAGLQDVPGDLLAGLGTVHRAVVHPQDAVGSLLEVTGGEGDLDEHGVGRCRQSDRHACRPDLGDHDLGGAVLEVIDGPLAGLAGDRTADDRVLDALLGERR